MNRRVSRSAQSCQGIRAIGFGSRLAYIDAWPGQISGHRQQPIINGGIRGCILAISGGYARDGILYAHTVEAAYCRIEFWEGYR